MSAQLRGLVPVLLLTFFIGWPPEIRAQDAYHSPDNGAPEPPAEEPSSYGTSPSELKKLPLEQLIDLQITSASRRPEKLSETSSAVDVITGEDIERAGITNIPDALRLGAEMDVAQIDGHTWAISARGFNGSISNKMQVLMDGRSLYTPLFSGVFWDVQQAFLPDIDQIEIIRGPGATLWGANAVNGVINIRTKSADETQGVLLYGGGGFEQDGFGGVRYGGKVGEETYYRLYVMHQNNEGLPLEGDGGEDEFQITKGGFRIDSKAFGGDIVTLQGDFYGGKAEQLSGDDIDVDGQNILGRWTHQFAGDSSLTLQSYWDRTYRLVPGTFEEGRNTFDIETQYQTRLGEHYIVAGANYRLSHDDISNLGPGIAFIPESDTQHLASGYVQDEWRIIPDTFFITGGSKFEWNSFSGFEIQPTGRFTWLPSKEQTVWGAISRAVRTPTRIDEDLVAPNPGFGGAPLLIPNRNFDSETLIAYELGYRFRPTTNLSFDAAAYYNDYDNLRSVEPLPGGRFQIQNKLEGESYGGSLTAKWQVTEWWQVGGNVSLFHVDIHRAEGGRDLNNGTSESNDPECSFVIHSAMDLPWHVRFDAYLRYVDDLPSPPHTPSYLTADVRLAWTAFKNCEIAIVGRNLFDDAHPEFATTNITREVERTVYGTFKWSF